MKKFIAFAVVIIAATLLIVGLTTTLSKAQVSTQPNQQSQREFQIESRSSYIPIQGRLTDQNGTPLNGSYQITFRLYDVFVNGSPLCEDVQDVSVENGLFLEYINMLNCDAIDGRQLYLGIQVESDHEMIARSFIDNVPYAWSLRPGAVISGTVGPGAILHIENWDPNGRGLRAYVMSPTGTNYAVIGGSVSPNAYGGYFYNNSGGIGLYSSSTSGTAIIAAGTGIIKSSANSYVWVSGNGLHKYLGTDTTIIDLDSIGGAKIKRGGPSGTRNVMLPITITGPLYGQPVKLTGLDIYFQTDSDLDVITAVLLRRQTGVCSTSSCYVNILYNTSDYGCEDSAFPTGCTQHFDLTTNNIITDGSGIVYLTIELAFSGDTTWIDIGGIRLTLEHD